jgi:hypothetical protein
VLKIRLNVQYKRISPLMSTQTLEKVVELVSYSFNKSFTNVAQEGKYSGSVKMNILACISSRFYVL